MRIKIVSVQRHPQKEIASLEEEYLKRLSGMIITEVVNIRPKGNVEKLIQEKLAGDENWVLLDPEGREFSTPELAGFLSSHMNRGTKSLAFLIGGAEGVSSKLKDRAPFRWSLSKLTFPHRLVRLLVLEALYRAADVLRGGPYHKE